MRMAMVVTVVLFSAAAGAAPASAQNAEPQTIAAAGVGRVSLVPDQAEIFVSADRIRPTSRAARAAVNRVIAAARRAILRQGIDRQAIQTSGVSVSRERRRVRRGGPVRIRFRASSQLTVLSRDIPGLGRLIDAVADTGADVFGPEFSFTDRSQGDILATRAALADARRRADDAAAQLGMRVTGIQSVDLEPDVGFGFDDSGEGASGGGGGGGGTRIHPGLEEFVALVKVVYTVAP